MTGSAPPNIIAVVPLDRALRVAIVFLTGLGLAAASLLPPVHVHAAHHRHGHRDTFTHRHLAGHATAPRPGVPGAELGEQISRHVHFDHEGPEWVDHAEEDNDARDDPDPETPRWLRAAYEAATATACIPLNSPVRLRHRAVLPAPLPVVGVVVTVRPSIHDPPRRSTPNFRAPPPRLVHTL